MTRYNPRPYQKTYSNYSTKNNYNRARAMAVYTTKKKAQKATKRRIRKKIISNSIYLIFLAFASVLTVLMCVQYLSLKATIIAQNRTNESLESRLYQLKGENDALEDSLKTHLDLAEIKEIAINELGMHEPTSDQIVWYEADDSSYIKQYSEVPK